MSFSTKFVPFDEFRGKAVESPLQKHERRDLGEEGKFASSGRSHWWKDAETPVSLERISGATELRDGEPHGPFYLTGSWEDLRHTRFRRAVNPIARAIGQSSRGFVYEGDFYVDLFDRTKPERPIATIRRRLGNWAALPDLSLCTTFEPIGDRRWVLVVSGPSDKDKGAWVAVVEDPSIAREAPNSAGAEAQQR